MHARRRSPNRSKARPWHRLAVRPRKGALLVAVVLAPLLAGCFADLERAGIDTTWSPDVDLYDGPSRMVDGWPAMLVAEGVATLPPGVAVEVTGVGARLVNDTDTRALTPVRLLVGDEALRPGESDAPDVLMRDGDLVTATFAPSASDRRTPTPGTVIEVEVEVQWRFREGDRFDAGRLEFEGNATVERSPGLGVGVAEIADGRVQTLLFSRAGQEPVAGPAEVRAFTVTSDSVRRLSPVQAQFATEHGVAIGTPTPKLVVPEGSGYLILVSADAAIEGVVMVDLGHSEENTPGPGVLAVAVVLGLAALASGARSAGGSRRGRPPGPPPDGSGVRPD